MPWQIFEDKVDVFFVDERLVEHDYKIERLHDFFGCHECHIALCYVFRCCRLRYGAIALFRSSGLNHAMVHAINAILIVPLIVATQFLQNLLLVFDVLYALPAINAGFWDDFQGVELALVHDQIDRAKLAIANLDACLAVFELFFEDLGRSGWPVIRGHSSALIMVLDSISRLFVLLLWIVAIYTCTSHRSMLLFDRRESFRLPTTHDHFRLIVRACGHQLLKLLLGVDRCS